MTRGGSSSDDFDRIVEGLDLDLTGLDDFDAEAARIAASQESGPAPRESAPAEPTEAEFYREVGPADLRADPRIKAAWFIVVGGPAAMILAMLASFTPPTPVVVVVIAAAVGAVVYLIARLPDRGPSNPDWPDDGAAL